jgi:hypothetical protein
MQKNANSDGEPFGLVNETRVVRVGGPLQKRELFPEMILKILA